MSKRESSITAERTTFLTPELVEVQGKNDREFLTHRVKLILDAKEQFPQSSIGELSKLVDLTACGCGCCCCCDTLILPGSDVVLPG
jgi:hypothetical protein